GHAEGDRALRVVARALADTARASDTVCRYGGDEFCLVLPATGRDAAGELAERIREAVPAACAREGVARVTVTIGIAASPEDGAAPDELLEAADRRLYRGKEAGRDRVVAA
ncbi:MAG: GGDEF domain-containing protein, partial [Gammaproteobacteria bacterium]